MKTPILLALALSALSHTSMFAQNKVDYRDLGKDTVIVGQLGIPLGTVAQVDVTIIAGRALGTKADSSAYLLKVTKVGSNPVAKPPICQFRTHSWDRVQLACDTFSLYELKKGKKTGQLSDSQIRELENGYVGQTYRLLVYEQGYYSGIPKDLPEDVAIWQDTSFAFSTHLIVLRILDDSQKPDAKDGARKPLGE